MSVKATDECGRKFRNGEPVLSEIDSWCEDLLKAQFSTAKALVTVDPTCSCTRYCGCVYAVHGDLTILSIRNFEIFPYLLKCDLRARTTGSVHRRDLLSLGIVEKTEHITTDTGGSRFSDIDGCCDCDCSILITISMFTAD